MSQLTPSSPEGAVQASFLERRAFVRYASDLTAACRPSSGRNDAGWLGRVRDISTGGIGLFLRHRFRRGTPLLIELRLPNGANLGEKRVEVMHTTAARIDGELGWCIGCAFTAPLTETELRSLLA
jgi:hypothetical protein